MRDGLREEFLRLGRIVPDGVPGARLIFNLHHDDCALGVHRFQVSHERAEGVNVRCECGWRVRRWRIHAVALFPDDAGVFVRLVFHPQRDVMRAAVFPGAEPEQHQPHVCLRACVRMVSTTEVSNFPGSGSNCSQ